MKAEVTELLYNHIMVVIRVLSTFLGPIKIILFY